MDEVDYGVVDLKGPWATRVHESQLHYLYVVRSGPCWFERLGGAPPFRISVGDVIGVTNNVAHSLRDAVETAVPSELRSLPLAPLRGAPPPPPEGRRWTRLFVGWVPFHVDPLVRFLPTVIFIPKGNVHGARIRHLADLAETELASQSIESGASSVVRRLSEIVVIELIRFLAEEFPGDNPVWSRGLVDPDIARAIASLHEDPGRHWTVDALARIAALSRAAFEARFRRFADQSPQRYIAKLRMQRAVADLERGTRSVAEIADVLGYASVASFHRAFRRELGVTPADYRRGVDADRRSLPRAR